MFHKTLAQGFFVFASLAIFLAMFGWSVQDIWLASTQWLEIAVVFLLMAIYVRISEADDEEELKDRLKTVKNGKASKKKLAPHQSFRLSE